MSVTLVVHVQPGAKQTAVVGWHGDAVKIRVAAPPVDGAANAELVRFLMARLQIPKGSVRLVAGTTSRRKRLEVEGIERNRALELLGVRIDP